MKLNVYLSGAVAKVPDNFQQWRDQCLDYAQYYTNLKFIDPNTYFNYTDKLPDTDKQCQDLFIWMIDKCDVMLVNLDDSYRSVGTGMEVEHAFCNNIPIIGFGNYEATWYPWVGSRVSAVFEDLEDAIHYISHSYGTIGR